MYLPFFGVVNSDQEGRDGWLAPEDVLLATCKKLVYESEDCSYVLVHTGVTALLST